MNALKQVNDKYGHAEGDKALSTIAKVLLKSDKNDTLFYRIGGDEFVALCLDIDENKVNKIINKINDGMKKTKYSVSIGYEMCNELDNKYDVYKIADEKMYKANEDYYLKNNIDRRRK